MNLENKKQIATMLLAVGLGLVAAFLTSQYVQTNIQAQINQVAQQQEQKNKELLKQLEQRDKALQQQMVQIAKQTRPAAPAPAQEAQAAPRQEAAFSLQTPPGKRAMTIMIDSLSAVGGLISPGDFVDIIAHLKVPKNNNEEDVTAVLMQNIQVLAVGTEFAQSGKVPAYDVQQKARSLNVTLALDPTEAGLLTFAQSNGKLQLTLRSPAEKEGAAKLETASWEALAEYVSEKQGTELTVPKTKVDLKEVKTDDSGDEVKPFIEVFKAGQKQL